MRSCSLGSVLTNMTLVRKWRNRMTGASMRRSYWVMCRTLSRMLIRCSDFWKNMGSTWSHLQNRMTPSRLFSCSTINQPAGNSEPTSMTWNTSLIQRRTKSTWLSFSSRVVASSKMADKYFWQTNTAIKQTFTKRSGPSKRSDNCQHLAQMRTSSQFSPARKPISIPKSTRASRLSRWPKLSSRVGCCSNSLWCWPWRKNSNERKREWRRRD